MAESVGTFDKLWISAGDTDASYGAMEFLEGSTLGAEETLTDPNGIRGTRQHAAARVRITQRRMSGTLQFAPSATELDKLLPWILGAAAVGNVFDLAETVPSRFIKTLRDGTKHKYNGVKVNRAVFAASEGGLLTVTTEVLGLDEAVDAGATETGAIDDASGPYVLADCVLTVGGTIYPFRSIEIEVNNFVEQKFNNSLGATSTHATDLVVGVALQLPYGDASALHGSALSGVAVVATFTNGNRSIAFNLAGVTAPRSQLPIGMRRARDLTWNGTARRTGSTPPISVTNDSTP